MKTNLGIIFHLLATTVLLLPATGCAQNHESRDTDLEHRANLLVMPSCGNVTEGNGEGSLRLIFAGDLMGHNSQNNTALQKDGSHDYNPCFRFIKDYIGSADLAIVNLEVTLGGKPYSGYPFFSAPDELAEAAVSAGFDIFTTANNHCMDKGRRGLERTLQQLDSMGAMHLGTYADAAQRDHDYPLIVERNGIRLALLCYTYGTNGIAVRQPNIVNLIDTTTMRRDLDKARDLKADYIITMIHWGIEYVSHANAEQQRIAQWLLNHGCNAVIGGHPHVVQNLTADAIPDNGRYPEVVVYSMGNLVSGMRSEKRDGGIMIEMELSKKKGKTEMSHCAYMPYWVYNGIVDRTRQYYILPSTDALEHPESYQLDRQAIARLQRFHDNTHRLIGECLPKGLPYPSAAFGCINESRFYSNRRTPSARLYTYFSYNYDNEFPGCPDTDPIYVYCSRGETSVLRTAKSGVPLLDNYDLVDSTAGCILSILPNGEFPPLPYNGTIKWDSSAADNNLTVYRTFADGNKIEVYLQRSNYNVTPAPALGQLPGIVTSIHVNGRVLIQLKEEKRLEAIRSTIPFGRLRYTN